MKIRHIIIAGAFGIALAGCSSNSISDLAPSLAPKKPAKTSEQNIKDQKAAICEWTEAAGLPHRNPVRKEVLASDMSRSDKKAYSEFDRKVVGTSVARQCLCGDEELQKTLNCEDLRS